MMQNRIKTIVEHHQESLECFKQESILTDYTVFQKNQSGAGVEDRMKTENEDTSWENIR